jgi:hypothetical protein
MNNLNLQYFRMTTFYLLSIAWHFVTPRPLPGAVVIPGKAMRSGRPHDH